MNSLSKSLAYNENEIGYRTSPCISPRLLLKYSELKPLNRIHVPTQQFQDITLFLLMYADDINLISESVEGLQNMLNTLYDYTISVGSDL
jgi:hypothetical protein